MSAKKLTRAQLELENKYLKDKIEEFEGRGQSILNMMAKHFTYLLKQKDENGRKITPSPSMMNTIRQFLKDNNITDLRGMQSPINHLERNYKYETPPEADADYGAQEG